VQRGRGFGGLPHEYKAKFLLIQQNMKFDEVVKQLKDNEHLLRRKEREAMERRIDEMEQRHRAEIQNAQSHGDSDSGTDLLINLLPLVGSFAMRLMGFPF
jgi:hypothetical protein